MYKIGLKLWSTNNNYIEEVERLFDKSCFDYIELFVVPGSFREYINIWKDLNIPYIIHAPHSYAGLNLAKKTLLKNNAELINETLFFADDFNVKYIIFHPGIDGDINQTISELNNISDSRILIENKPYYTIDKKFICNGYSPTDIKFILRNTNVNFCFDIGHAIYAANAQSIDPFNYLKEFNEVNPKMYHLADGDWNGIIDLHKNLGRGSFDFKKILKIVPKGSFITLETPKGFKDSLKDFEQDILFFRSLL